MKKTLCALGAIAAICGSTGALAQSQVTTYGLIDVMVRHTTNAPGIGQNTVSDGAYTGSRLGFKGTEDLGSGLSALFSIEMGLNPSSGALQQSTATPGLGQVAAPTGRAWGRESLVGLSSTTWGTLTLGRQYTIAHQLSGRFQPQSNPNDSALSVFSGHHVARQDQMAKYSVNVGPVMLVATRTANEGDGKAWGVGANYQGNGLDISAYASDMDIDGVGSDTRKIRGLGAAYQLNTTLKLYGGAMWRTQEASTQKNKVLTVGTNYQLTDRVGLTASYTDDQVSGSKAGHRRVALIGANYQFSKRTDVYAELDNNKISGTYSVPSFMGTEKSLSGLGVGLRHRF